MRCNVHSETEAIALCRVCSVGICRDCAKPAIKGFGCSDVCLDRAKTIDRMLDIQAVNLRSTSKLSYFFVPAFLLVLGVLLIGEEQIFGTPRGAFQVIFGIVSLILGVGYFLYVLYNNKNSGT